jgi:glucose/arabinose dehydrogenase
VSPFSFTYGPDGNIYVGASNVIYRIEHVDSPDRQAVSDFSIVDGRVYGVVFVGTTLYAAINRDGGGEGDEIPDIGQLVSFESATGSGPHYSQVEVDNLPIPANRYGAHANNGLTADSSGLVYMTIGSDNDHRNHPQGKESPGAVMTFNPATDAVETIAEGFRNPWDITTCADGSIFATDNGPNELDDTLFYRPPDELNKIVPGRTYGHPDEYGAAHPGSESESPYAILPVSAGVTGIMCHSGNEVPEWKDRMFVALSGSSVIPEQTGKKILIVEPLSAGETGYAPWESLVEQLGIPVDVIEHTDGSVLILDLAPGSILKVNKPAVLE